MSKNDWKVSRNKKVLKYSKFDVEKDVENEFCEKLPYNPEIHGKGQKPGNDM